MGNKGMSLVELMIATAVSSILFSAMATSGSMLGRMNADINAMSTKSELYMQLFQLFNSQKACGRSLAGEKVSLVKGGTPMPIEFKDDTGAEPIKQGAFIGKGLKVKSLTVNRTDDKEKVFGDYDEDGIVTLSELNGCLEYAMDNKNPEAPYDDEDKLILACNTDNDNKVKVNDLVRMASIHIDYDIITNPDLPGDCNQDGSVSLSELMIGRALALNSDPTGEFCLDKFDLNTDGKVTVNELVKVVGEVDKAATGILNVPAEINLVTQNVSSGIESPRKFSVFLRVKPKTSGNLASIVGCGVDNNL